MTDTDILFAPSDLPYRLPAEAYAYLVRALDCTLPPPPDESDETKTLRKQSIVARISTLRPNDAIEAGLAADHIIAAEQSRDAVRWVHIYRANGEHKLAAQTQAHALSYLRAAQRTLREIDRLQAATKKRHADPEATDTAERIEHITMVMTAEAVDKMPDPTPPPYVPQKPAPAKPSISKTSPQSLQTKTENPPRQPERPSHYESPARRAMLDQAQFGRREPDPNRRYPGKSGAMLLQRRHEQADPKPGDTSSM